MSATGFEEGVSDYSGFDFAGLWRGRDRVTGVEQAVMGTALATGDARRRGVRA